MKNNLIAYISVLLCIYNVTHEMSITTGPVRTENGEVIGTKNIVNGKNVYSFKGIHFGIPPIGDLRFKPSKPVNNWNGTYNATFYRPACWQPGIPGLTVPSLSEDCLYLNIWTPTLNEYSDLSVMIWIFGGGFLVGSASDAIPYFENFDATYLALRNVVVVTFNYRLSIFGFLYGNSSEAPGNAGLWDQVMAINWTRRNIANFGGNPNDITLFGESSGSFAISDLIVTNPKFGIRYWFNKVILLSGAAYEISRAEQVYEYGREYAKNQFNCANDQTWVECLKQIPAPKLFASELVYSIFILAVIFTPIHGDTLSLIPYNPFEAVKRGYFNQNLRVLINNNEMEGEAFILALDILRGLGGRYITFVDRPLFISKKLVRRDVLNDVFFQCPFKQQIVEAFVNPFTRIGIKLNPQPIRRSIAYALGDYIISCRAILFGSYMTKRKSFKGKVFQTRLTYQNSFSLLRSHWTNVTHSDDLALDFGLPLFTPGYSSDDIFISNKMMDLFTHFAKTAEVPLLNPTVYNEWPPYTVNNGVVNASYIELHPHSNRLGKVFINQYRGNDGYFPKDIYNCFHFWEQYILNFDDCTPAYRLLPS